MVFSNDFFPVLGRTQSQQSLQGGNLQRSRSLQSLNQVPLQRGRSRSRSRTRVRARTPSRGPRSGSAGPGNRFGPGPFARQKTGPPQRRNSRSGSVGRIGTRGRRIRRK